MKTTLRAVAATPGARTNPSRDSELLGTDEHGLFPFLFFFFKSQKDPNMHPGVNSHGINCYERRPLTSRAEPVPGNLVQLGEGLWGG